MTQAEEYTVAIDAVTRVRDELLALQARISQMTKEASMSGRSAAELVRNLAARDDTLQELCLLIAQLRAARLKELLAQAAGVQQEKGAQEG